MAFGFKRQPNPAPSSTLDKCAADYAGGKTQRQAGGDDNSRANASEAAASRTTRGR